MKLTEEQKQNIIDDYESWKDKMLYEYFGLTTDEIKEIEKEIK